MGINSDISTDEHCRFCGGSKGFWELDDRQGRYVSVWDRCDFCRGTGRQTVRIDRVPLDGVDFDGDLILNVLRTGRISRDDADRAGQLKWARRVMRTEDRHTPYRRTMAALIISHLSNDTIELDMADEMRERALSQMTATPKGRGLSMAKFATVCVSAMISIWLIVVIVKVAGVTL